MQKPRDTPKPVKWHGSSLSDLKDERIFPVAARIAAGYQLKRVQNGLDPDDWKPFNEVGQGTKEIRISDPDGWYRVLYVAKFADAVHVLHCFRKKTNTTSKRDKEIAAARYARMIEEM